MMDRANGREAASCMKRRCDVIRRAIVLAVSLGVFATMHAPRQAHATLEVQGDRLYYCGQPINLVGYGFYGPVTEASFPYKKYLNKLANNNLNYVRVWANFHWTHSLTPYKGGWKDWDLTQPNEAFFARLTAFIAHAHSKGIIVQVALFDSVALEDGSPGNRWPNCPFNKNNNAQGYCKNGQQADDLDGTPPIWNQSHKWFIDRVTQAAYGYDNVIFEVMNEPYPGYGSQAFNEAVINRLHANINAPDYVGSQIISVNDDSYSLINNSKVDMGSYHVHSTGNISGKKGKSKPVIISNDGDSSQNGCVVTSSCLSSSDRIARIKTFAQKTFADVPKGKMHLEILDKDIYGSSWLSQDYNPSIGNMSSSMINAIKPYGKPPTACGTTPEPGGPGGPGGPVDCAVPVGTEIVIDNGKSGFSQTGSDWKLRDGQGQTVGATYLYLSKEVGDPLSKKGKAKWKPNVPVAGIYNVQVTFRATMNRTSDADYFVFADDGTSKKKVIDQRDGATTEEDGHGPVYVSMGNHYFHPDGDGHVLLDGTDDNQSDCADAAVFTLIECTDEGGGGGGGGTTPEPPPETPPPPPPVECPSGGPGPQTATVYATTVLSSNGWSNKAAATGKNDGTSATTPNLEKGEALIVGGFGACDPEGPETITAVEIGVRSKVQYSSGPYAIILALSGGGAGPATFSHTNYGWDNLDITDTKADWTWADVQALQAKLALHEHPNGNIDSDVWVDAFRVRVTFETCGAISTPQCQGDQVVAVDGCGTVTEVLDPCDDGDECTADSCHAAACIFTEKNTLECIDPVPPPECTPDAQLTCFGGALFSLDSCNNLGAMLDSCDDEFLCSLDSCDPNTLSCTHEALEGPLCESCVPKSGKACVGNDVYWVDSCGNVGEIANVCEDGNSCTINSCDAESKTCTKIESTSITCTGCTPNAAKVCLADALYWIDSCGNVTGLDSDCDDGDACTIDLCDSDAQACVHLPAVSEACAPCEEQHSTTCYNGMLYWVDSCSNLAGLADTCDDGEPCTFDVCDPTIVECIHQPVEAPGCDACEPSAEWICDGEGAVVSVDGCGNVESVVDVCNDGDPCTADGCAGGVCVSSGLSVEGCPACEGPTQIACQGAQLIEIDACGNELATIETCSDGDPCTIDGCDPVALSCQSEPSDSSECQECVPHVSTLCTGGQLWWVDSCGSVGEVAAMCEDGDACTVDGCDDKSGLCAFLPSVSEECVDAAPVCDAPDEQLLTCSDEGHLVWTDGCGVILGLAESCTDDDPCTADACDPAAEACIHTLLATDGCGGIDPGDECDVIVGTVCVGNAMYWVDDCGGQSGQAKLCDDGDPCTEDSCTAEDGICVFAPLDTPECGGDETDAGVGGPDGGGEPDASETDAGPADDTSDVGAESDTPGESGDSTPGDGAAEGDTKVGPDGIDGSSDDTGGSEGGAPQADAGSGDGPGLDSEGSGSGVGVGRSDGGCRANQSAPHPFGGWALWAIAGLAVTALRRRKRNEVRS